MKNPPELRMPHSNDLAEASAGLLAFGTARADAASINALRKSLPPWAPSDTPGHFLKHADEQTVVAIAALDEAIRALGGSAGRFQDWAIIAAPRFIGRLIGADTLDRYAKAGGPAVSPHLIPQHSLHSISGALSILLASRQPNFGVGGTAAAVTEGLLAALTCPAANCSGVWLVITAWDPEPQVGEHSESSAAPVCYAVALGLERAAGSGAYGRLRLRTGAQRHVDRDLHARWDCDAAAICRRLAALIPGGPTTRFAWRVAGSASLVLEAREAIAGLRAAA
jgi:hypothetical protein